MIEALAARELAPFGGALHPRPEGVATASTGKKQLTVLRALWESDCRYVV